MRDRGQVTTTQTPASRTVDLGGETHYLDFGGPAAGPLVVCVHGLGGAAWNWLALGPLLTGSARVLALDLAGHGLSPAAGRPTTVGANRRLLDRFLHEVAGEPVVLVGNSMGGLITMLEAAASPELVRGLVLVDPALPRSPLSPTDARATIQFAVAAAPVIAGAMYARRRNRLSARKVLRGTLALCTVDVDRIPDEVLVAAQDVVRRRDVTRFPPRDVGIAARSVMRRMAGGSELRAAMTKVTAPVLLIHGDKDRLVPVAAARRTASLFPHWRCEIAHDIGHVPMLEAPQWTATTILDWLAADVHAIAQ
jgi:pimeloyl-ACP methyl ester carboxylesterase